MSCCVPRQKGCDGVARTSLHSIVGQHVKQALLARSAWARMSVQLVVYAALIGVLWPRSQTVDSPAQPGALLWLSYLHTYLLGRIVLHITAHTGAGDEDILPHEWLRFGYGSPFGVVLSHTLIAPMIALAWTAVSSPVFITASLLHGKSVAWGGLLLFWTLFSWALAFWGTLAAITVQQRRQRLALCDGLWAGFMLAALLLLYVDTNNMVVFGTSLPSWLRYNPLLTVHVLIGDTPPMQGAPWTGQLAVAAAITAGVTGFSVHRIWRWRSRHVTGTH